VSDYGGIGGKGQSKGVARAKVDLLEIPCRRRCSLLCTQNWEIGVWSTPRGRPGEVGGVARVKSAGSPVHSTPY
jgi:hypothetical protein